MSIVARATRFALPTTIIGVLAASAVLAGGTVADAKPAPKPTLRIVPKTFNPTIPADDGTIGGDFADSQYMSHACKSTEASIAPGIVDADRYIAAQSFGPTVVSGFAAGAAGRATMRMQLLCLKNAKVTNMRVAAKNVPGLGGTVGGRPAGRATAELKCPVGTVALGSPLSQEFAPGYGSFSSVPNGVRGWKVVVNGVPEPLAAANVVAAYAAASCVPAKVAKKTVRVKGTATMTGGVATTTVACHGGRRPLAFGVELAAYTTSPRDGAWATPYVKRAQFTASGIAFTFALPAGVDASRAEGSIHTGHAVCGVV